MEAKQLRNFKDIVGRCISNTYIDANRNLLIFFEDNTWIVLDEGEVAKEEYFSDAFQIREYQWGREFVEKTCNPMKPEDIEITDLGQKFIDLGYLTREQIISDWVTFESRMYESQILVKKTKYYDWKKEDPEFELNRAKESYKKFQESFGQYINKDWGHEESDF